MNWYKIFYWLTVADNFKVLFIVGIVTFSIALMVALGFFITCRDEYTFNPNTKAIMAKKWLWYLIPFIFLWWALFLFTPSKSDTLLIIAGGAVGNFITSDTNSKAIPADITLFLKTRIKEEILSSNEEVRRQLNMETPKERLINQAKKMTKEQLIEYLKNDTTLIK